MACSLFFFDSYPLIYKLNDISVESLLIEKEFITLLFKLTTIFSAYSFWLACENKVPKEKRKINKVIIKDVQFDPVTDKIVHIDLQGITLGEVLQLEVPISYIGTAAGVIASEIRAARKQRGYDEFMNSNDPRIGTGQYPSNKELRKMGRRMYGGDIDMYGGQMDPES